MLSHHGKPHCCPVVILAADGSSMTSIWCWGSEHWHCTSPTSSLDATLMLSIPFVTPRTAGTYVPLTVVTIGLGFKWYKQPQKMALRSILWQHRTAQRLMFTCSHSMKSLCVCVCWLVTFFTIFQEKVDSKFSPLFTFTFSRGNNHLSFTFSGNKSSELNWNKCSFWAAVLVI